VEKIMEPRCRAGDLAVIIYADYRCNLGRIVRVLAQHDGKGDIAFHGVDVVWLVESSRPITWTVGTKRFRRKRGPVPDTYLKPIRGNPLAQPRNIFTPKQEESSEGKAVGQELSSSVQSEREYIGMDDPRWMEKAQKQIDECLDKWWSEKARQRKPDESK
jgi:hypothetical protein